MRSGCCVVRFAIPVALALGLSGLSPAAQESSGIRAARQSVVKVYATVQYFDYSMPWLVTGPGSGTGSGLIIEKRRILTNAHVVSNARYIEVQKEGDPKRYLAEVAFAGHDCDLALLRVPDADFFKGTCPLRIGLELPNLNDDVMVLGYPLGGTRLSITKGVISRIDYSRYSHSGADNHLVLQVDAAINPGNSGGPVLYKGEVAGVAFQVLTQGQNIGYAIPVPVVKHFLDDIADGKYHGYPELGVAHMELSNSALRRDLRLPSDRTGVVIYYVDPFGSAQGDLKPGDVLLSIDGHSIANDGTIRVDGNEVDYPELLERKQWGDLVAFQVWRYGTEIKMTIPLNSPYDPFAFRNVYDQRPRYLILGGLVFSPLSNEYLRTLGHDVSGQARQHLVYYSQFAKVDGLYKDRDEFVVLVNRLAHRVNAYCDEFLHGIVSEVNGVRISGLRDMKKAIGKPRNGFHVIRFEGNPNALVLKAQDADGANTQVLAVYAVPLPEFLGD